MAAETVIILLVLGALGGFLAGHWVADFRRARIDASRIMRTRSNYRRSGKRQK